MSQDYIPVMTPLAPGQVARAAQVNERYENVVAGFERLPNPLASGKGFSGPVRVGEPVNGDDAATRNFVENGANSFYLHAQQAAEAAGLSADAAADSEQASADSALAAQDSASLAGDSADTADQAKIDAQAARDSASGHRLNAQNAATAAANSADQAELSASSASDDASAAGIAALAAANSATAADTSADSASTHASNANSSASSASSSASAAGSAATLAQAWAESGTEIEPGKYSAKYWAEQAASIVSGGILDDDEVNSAQGWSSQKISTEINAVQQSLDDYIGSAEPITQEERDAIVSLTETQENLGTGAFNDVTESPVDTEIGRGRRVGDFGSPVTFDGAALFSSDFNTLVPHEVAVTTSGTWEHGPLNPSGGAVHAGMLYQTPPRTTDGVTRQTWVQQGSAGQPVAVFWRNVQSDLGPEDWGPWSQVLHNNNVKTVNGESISGPGNIELDPGIPTLEPATDYSILLIGLTQVVTTITTAQNANNSYGVKNAYHANIYTGSYTNFAILNQGEIRVSLDHLTNNGSYTSTARIYLNNTLLNSWTNATTSYITRTIDIEVMPGDRITISHAISNSVAQSWLRNVLVRSNNPIMVLI